MSFDIKSYLHRQIELGLTRFTADLRAIDEKHRSTSPGGIARSPYDFAYELAVVNQDYARRLRGEESTAPAGFDFHQAPPDFHDVEKAITALEAATRTFLAVWDSVAEENVEVPLPGGKVSAVGLATTVNRHLHYHDAQLNYIQTLLGDGEVHWP